MKIPELVLLLCVIAGGIYLLRFCSGRFMMLRRSKSLTPYLYGIGGILSLMLITLALFGAVMLFIAPLR
ncbi:MAG: hypothetical protein WA817_22215 [Candidatus Acidiferrum sp.]